MPYVGILLTVILVSFIVVRIGAFALQLTGMGPEIATFQALSAFSGTGFTTTEAERVVRNRARRRIITILIILGNAGLVTVIATLVVSFTQVTGYGWFFIRLGIIVVGIIIFYRFVIRSRIGNRFIHLLRKPLLKSVLKGAPEYEEIYQFGKNWGINLVIIYEDSKNIGLSLTEFTAEKDDLQVLAIDRDYTVIPKPDNEEKIMSGDRLLIYGKNKSIEQLLKGV